ncbi:MAG: hypothetical protein ACSLFK_14440 [Gemmatimonadaceae bacterium]
MYRSTTGAEGVVSLIGTARRDARTATDSAVLAGQEYCYEVRAIQASGKSVLVSAFSNTACATIPAPPPPPASPPLSASQTTVRPLSSSSVFVQWTAVGLDFRIEKSLDNGASWSVAGVASNIVYFTDHAQTEQRVCYRVVSFNVGGDAVPSNTACTTPPAAVASITVTQIDAETIEIKWIDNSAVEDGYLVWFQMFTLVCGYESGWSESDLISAGLPANSTAVRIPAHGLVLEEGVCGGYQPSLEIQTLKDGGYSSSTYNLGQ